MVDARIGDCTVDLRPKKKPQKVLITRMCYDGQERYEIGNWLIKTALENERNPLVTDTYHLVVQGVAPVASARNQAVKAALSVSADILVMVDHDIIPAPGFVAAAVDFIAESQSYHYGPAVCISPAVCGDGSINILRWGYQGPGDELPVLEKVSRSEAPGLSGVEQVAAGGAGLIAIHTGAFARLSAPFFYLEYEGEWEDRVATTEDIAFTRDCGIENVSVFALWDHWSGHQKSQVLSRPEGVMPYQLPSKLRERLVPNR